jgi:hypothetical protein
MQIFSNSVLLIAVVTLIAICFVQSEYVDWRKDKCGVIGVWSVGTSSAYMLLCLLRGDYIHPAAGLLIVGFTLWLLCRKLNKMKYPSGPLGQTDRPPLSEN